jgi:lipoprotein-releasing system ATP-binding protein
LLLLTTGHAICYANSQGHASEGERLSFALKSAGVLPMSLLVRDLTKSYPTRSGSLQVLRGVSLNAEPGQALAIMGPSGSGKSTLLYIIGTLDSPTTGEVLLANTNPFSLVERELAVFRNRSIGFVFQDHHLLPQCSVFENVLIPTLVANENQASIRSRALHLLERVGLSQRLDHRPAELSGGERQRVSVARALILQPTLILADEPTGNLDRTTAREVGQLLLELAREEKRILVTVTHSAELAATFPTVYEMNEGQLHPKTLAQAGA